MKLIFLFVTVFGNQPTPEIVLCHPTSPVIDVYVEDVQDDGERDVIAICQPERPNKPFLLNVFLGKGNGVSEVPTLIQELPSDLLAMCFAESNGEPPRELICVRRNGATLFSFDKTNKLNMQSEASFSFGGTLEICNPTFLRNHVFDLNKDGIEEWVFLRDEGISIFKGTQIYAIAPIRVTGFASTTINGNLAFVHTLPAFYVFEQEAPLPLGLVFADQESITIVGGASWQNCWQLPIPFQTTTDEKQSCFREKSWAFPDPPKQSRVVLVKDLDRDNFPEIFLVEPQKDYSRDVVASFYCGSREKGIEGDARWQVTKNGFIHPILEDVNGDGWIDIVFLQMAFFDTRFLINYFLNRKVTFVAEVYINHQGNFELKPELNSTISVSVSETNNDGIFALADFTGDGLIDAAISEPDNGLSFYLGKSNRFLSAKPGFSFPEPKYGKSRIVDLNKNNCSDLIIYSVDKKGTLFTLQIFIF